MVLNMSAIKTRKNAMLLTMMMNMAMAIFSTIVKNIVFYVLFDRTHFQHHRKNVYFLHF